MPGVRGVIYPTSVYLLATPATHHRDEEFLIRISARRSPLVARFASASSLSSCTHGQHTYPTPPHPTTFHIPTRAQHFAAYSLEAWNGVERYGFDAAVSPRDEAETYFVAFNACVRDAKVEELMCSYNSVNGALVAC